MDHLTDSDKLKLLETSIVGEPGEPFIIDSTEQCRVASINMARQAMRTIHIYSHSLDDRVYNNHEFVSALTTLATSSRHAQIQILVRDTNPIIQHGHQVIEVMRRLTSFIQMRKVCEESMEYSQAFMIVDERGLILHRVATRYEGVVKFHEPMECRELLKHFHEVWRKSEPDPKLRRLHI